MNDRTNNPPFSKLEFSFHAHDSFSVIGELSRAAKSCVSKKRKVLVLIYVKLLYVGANTTISRSNRCSRVEDARAVVILEDALSPIVRFQRTGLSY